MVRRSLVAKSLIYATLVVCLSVPIAAWVGRQLMVQGRYHDLEKKLTPQFEAIGVIVEKSSASGGPNSEQLAALGAISDHDLKFHPWSASGTYPPELGKQRLILDPRPPEFDGKPIHHWLRLDRDGKPFGALELSPRFLHRHGPRGHHDRPPFPLFAGLWVLLIVAILVPPLWWWVIKPLRLMVGVANRLGAGDLDTAISVTTRDEFGELEKAFEGMRQKLKQTLQLKERLLTDVSHEVRGPLARMNLALPLLRQQGASGPLIDLMARELKSADELLERVLQLSRGDQSAQMRSDALDLADLAGQLLEDREIVANGKSLHLYSHLQPAPVTGDRHALGIAMANLLDNAFKYTQVGGEVAVTTFVEGEQAVFRVADNGPGIAAQHLPQVFEPFYRPDDSRSRETGGTGLGLSIVRGIAHAMGGDATIGSQLGKGTTADIRLPVRLEEKA